MFLAVLSAIAFGVITVNSYSGLEEHYQLVAQEQADAKVAQMVTIEKSDQHPMLTQDFNR